MIIQSTTLDTMEKVIAIYGGTTWEKIEGRFLLGRSDDYEINNTGGEAEHVLNVNEMPAHYHTETLMASGYSTWPQQKATTYGIHFDIYEPYDVKYTSNGTFNGTPVSTFTTTSSTGGSQGHNNMPPYKTVYIWERTS